MTPLTATVQLRPSLRYLDKISEKEKAASARIQQEEVKEKEKGLGPQVEEEGKLFQRIIRSNDDKDTRRKLELGQQQKMFDSEEWENLTMFNINVS